MKILKFISIFILIILIGFGLYFYITVYSKLTPATIDSNIKDEKIFRLMDSQKEIINGTERYDSIPRKRSSTVLFYADRKPKTPEEIKIAGSNNCRAIKWDGQIKISIGLSSGYSGGGYDIDYLYGRYKIKPYSFTDVVPDNSPEPEFKMLKQNVILNKRFYKVGDSIYGKIDFVLEHNNSPPNKHIVYGIGYFRTKIEE